LELHIQERIPKESLHTFLEWWLINPDMPLDSGEVLSLVLRADARWRSLRGFAPLSVPTLRSSPRFKEFNQPGNEVSYENQLPDRQFE
jgi:hypothetical protein